MAAVNEVCESGGLTNCQVQKRGKVRTAKESQRRRGTHFLSQKSTDGGACHDSERKPASRGHSRTVRPTKKGGEGGSSQDSERKQASQGNSRPVEQSGGAVR
jgi:hypothetical protein